MVQSVEGQIPSLSDSDPSPAMTTQSPGTSDETQALKRQILDKEAGNTALELEFDLARKNNRPLSIITLDVNGLKAVNDGMGHVDGDELIDMVEAVVEVPSLVRTKPNDKNPRRSDIVSVSPINYSAFEELHDLPKGSTAARIGGDEYRIILPDTDEAGVAVVAKRIKEAVDKRLAGPAGDKFRARGINVGVAIGVASLHPDMATSSDLERLSDQRMYMDKMLQVSPRTEEQLKHLRASLMHLYEADISPRDLPRYIEWLGQTGLEQLLSANTENEKLI
jgi:GGDEF domain-containing protein